jgi:hypothetical protein
MLITFFDLRSADEFGALRRPASHGSREIGRERKLAAREGRPGLTRGPEGLDHARPERSEGRHDLETSNLRPPA